MKARAQTMTVATALLALLSASVPPASAQASEFPLPQGLTFPSALRFDEAGDLWVALEGTWAVARIDLDSDEIKSFPLATPKQGERDSLWTIRFGPNGTVWTGSTTHVHRIDPATENSTAFELPEPTQLAGDLIVTSRGIVWYASVTGDVLYRLDPVSGRFTSTPTPVKPFGPLFFGEAQGTAYVTGTYAGSYATFDPDSGRLELAGVRDLNEPVELARRANTLWITEMGGNTIARVEPLEGKMQRYATTPSPYYPVSGPSGVHVTRDGIVWFAEHFADRLARLDPVNRTLHEYEVPSAPGTNLQRVAEAPDGAIWFAEYSRHQLGLVTFGGEDPGFTLPARVAVPRGGSARVAVAIPGDAAFGPAAEGLSARKEADGIVISATADAPQGESNFLVSVKRGDLTVGRYTTVVVEGARGADAPALAAGLAVAAVALAAVVARRRA